MVGGKITSTMKSAFLFSVVLGSEIVCCRGRILSSRHDQGDSIFTRNKSIKSYFAQIKEALAQARAGEKQFGEGKLSTPTPRRLLARRNSAPPPRRLRQEKKTANKDVESGKAGQLSQWLKSGNPMAMTWAFLGPGMLVCLADTDAGCLITAAQSGALWSYRLIGLNILLIPVLYLAQELTIRLAVATQQGHMACIRERFGPVWAWVTCALLLISCVGTIISEMSGIASVCEVWGINRLYGSLGSAVVLSLAVIFFNYKQVEVIGITFGMFECTFLLSMFLTKPNPLTLLKQLFQQPLTSSSYSQLIAANIGAVIMPFMIYFQQSAIVARKITTDTLLRKERSTTFVGSILTQMIMIATIISMAAVFKSRTNLHNVLEIAQALGPAFGGGKAGLIISKVMVSLGMIGGSISGAFVVSRAGAWAVCEAGGWDNRFSMDKSFMKAPLFYGSFLSVVVAGIIILLSGVDIVKLNVWIELLGGLLMPMAVGFLYLLASGPQCPDGIRIKGAHKYAVAILFAICSAVSVGFGFYAIITGNG